MDTITITIDGIEVKTTRGKRILEAALDAGIYIPNLCALRDIALPTGACRICQVQIEGKRGTVTACSEPAADGMVIQNNTPEINAIRRNILEIMLAKHPSVCLTCHRRQRCLPGDICLRLVEVTEEQCILCPNNGRCELQRVVDFVGLTDVRYPYKSKELPVERDNPYIVRNNNLCILCGRCVRVCQEVLGIEAISFNQRGIKTYIGGAFGKSLLESGCTFCGSCVQVCPTGALKDNGDEWDRWPDPKAASIRCQYACPAMMDVPRFIRLIRQKQFDQGIAVIRESVPFASLCSLICEHPCESACRRNKLDQGLAIRALERYCVENAGKYSMKSSMPSTPSGKKVAIVGSGPAGLTAAYYLANTCGHSVVVFEKQPQAGGMMRQIIPEFRLPRKILDKELERLIETGIEIKTDSPVEIPQTLIEQKYDAVLVATGIFGSKNMAIEGVNEEGVIDGFEFLHKLNNGKPVNIGGKVIIVGDGAVALYAARASKRLGATSVTLLSAMLLKEMLVNIEGIPEAQAEGIELKCGCAAVSINHSKGHLTLNCQPAPAYKLESAGRYVTLEADSIIMALEGTDTANQNADNDKYVTNTGKGIFSTGNMVTGKLSFIASIAAGKHAASLIDLYLGGSGNTVETLARETEDIPRIGRMPDFSQRKRNDVPCLSTAKRLKNFDQVEQGFDQKLGDAEADRCMGCDLRFYIARMTSTSKTGEMTSVIEV